MTHAGTNPGLTNVIAWAETRLPRLVDDAYDAILDRIPLYRDDHPVPHQDLRRSVQRNLRVMVAAIDRPGSPLDLSAPRETGRRRAHQGVPLPEVLRAYRVTFAVFWGSLVEAARNGPKAGTAEALLSAASLIWTVTDEHAVALTEGYRAATAELLIAEQHRRSALVEALLTGQPTPEGGPWEAARLLGLAPGADFVVVAADTSGLAAESLPGIERRLAARGIASGWRLTPSLQLGVISLRNDQRDDLSAELRSAATARTGVSPAYRSLVDSPRALQLARAALAVLPTGRPGLHVFSPSPLAALVARDPDEGRRLADEVLGAVLELPAEDRATLLDTLIGYLDHGGSAGDTAAALGCHPNTVRYRLRRLQELSGRSLGDPHGAAELTAAAYAIRLSTEPNAQRSGPSRVRSS